MTAPAVALTDPAAAVLLPAAEPSARAENPGPAGVPADPATERPRRRLHAVPTTATVVTEDPPAQAGPVTVTISIDGGAPESRDRVLAALRELVSAVGPGADVALRAPIEASLGEPGVISLDPAPRAAFRDGRLLDLSRLEYDLLLFFAEHPRQVFTRAQLLARVWGHVHTGARTVDVHISRLRTKLADHELITTVYGIGYRLADSAPIRVL
ncbi:winged helix-turn-helix domain-containing protein [Actinoplanes sp. NPDC051633]|uniref:winged helix-turn-helix domain-containing protein n=1 Tax=Actinoplanes sp. NPDC051633 TaxID=3155670 RepID=UPI003445C8E0